MTPTAPASPTADDATLFTRTRRIEAARIVIVAFLTLLYWRGVVPFPVLLVAIAIGVYPLARAGLLDLCDIGADGAHDPILSLT